MVPLGLKTVGDISDGAKAKRQRSRKVRVGMIFANKSDLCVAAGWVVLVVVAAHVLPMASVAIILVTLTLAECIGGILAPIFPDAGPDPVRAGADLERILLGWTFFVPLIIAAVHFEILEVYVTAPLATLCLLALSLLLPLAKLYGRHAAHWDMLFRLRLILVGLMFLGLHEIGVTHPEAFLLSAVLLLLTFLFFVFRAMPSPSRVSGMKTDRWKIPHDLSSILLRCADLLVAPFLLPSSAALTYVIARGVGCCVTVPLDHLIHRAHSSIGRQIENKPSAPYPVAAAARVNLGVFLVGGGVGLSLLSGMPYLPDLLGALAQDVKDVALWMILAAMGPAVFGAAPALLHLAGLERDVTAVCLGTTLVFLIAVLVQPEMTALQLAQTTAGCQLGAASVAAGLLAWRTDVWPGLTAVLFRQIKLF